MPSPPPSLPAPVSSLFSGLASKITLPFVALFAALLLALGWILAREILSDVEARVENEQRFVLEMATFPGWPVGEESLRRLIETSSPKSEMSGERAASEFIVLQNGATPLTTLARNDASGRALYEALLSELSVRPELEPRGEELQRHRVKLGGQDFLLLATSRTPRGTGGAPRRFFLLHPYSEIEQAKNRALWRIVAMGVAGLALAAGLGLALAHWIARPVRKLAAAAQRVTRAGLNEPLDAALAPDASARIGGEIGELTDAFRSMIESLRRSQADVLKAERLAATGKLAASVAHEIRNPLTSLRMTVEMLAGRQGDAGIRGHGAEGNAGTEGFDTREAYRIILNEIDRLGLAVEELLTFARPRPPQKAPCDLNTLCADALQFLERQMAHAKVRTTLEADAALPRGLMLDAGKMRQLLVNLILNAQQALVRGGEVVVRTKWIPLTPNPSPPRGEGNGGRAILEVQDSGPGVATEVRDKIFELFVTTKDGGGGLGLAIAKQIAEEHGGTIGFESAPGRTVFRVELPG